MKKGKPKPETVKTDPRALVRVPGIPRADIVEIIPVSKLPAKRGRRYFENQRHREAFEYYLTLGNERTLSKVAEHFNVSESQAMQWSWIFQWTKRIREFENRDIRQVIEDTGLQVILNKLKALFIIDPMDPQKIIIDSRASVGAIKDLVAAFVALEKNARERQEEDGGGDSGTGKVKNQVMVNVIITK